jgi:hypothetical protein
VAAEHDRLVEEGHAGNAHGIRAKVAADGTRYYSVREAAAMKGTDPSNLYKGATRLVGPDGREHSYVPATPVDESRSALLRRLGVADLSPAAAKELQRHRERIAVLEAQMRQVIGSRAAIAAGLQQQLNGEQGLLDAILMSLPAEEAILRET